jgi:hypothetical protein
VPIRSLDYVQQFQAINVLSDPGHINGPVVIPNCWKFMIVWTLTNGKIARNVLGVSVPAGATVTATIAEAMRAALVAGSGWSTLAAFMSLTGSLTRVELQDIRQASMPVVASTGAATAGTSASAALPDEVAAVLTLRTARVGPANRGRMYIPNFATNALAAGGVIAPAVVTAIGGWTPNISNAVTSQGFTQVLLQPARAAYTGTSGAQHPARAAGSLPLTNMVVRDNHWDSQRRRGLR